MGEKKYKEGIRKFVREFQGKNVESLDFTETL
jgi:hypothetical protein